MSLPRRKASPLGNPSIPTVLLRPNPCHTRPSIYASAPRHSLTPANKSSETVSRISPLLFRLFGPEYSAGKGRVPCTMAVFWTCQFHCCSTTSDAGALETDCALVVITPAIKSVPSQPKTHLGDGWEARPSLLCWSGLISRPTLRLEAHSSTHSVLRRR